MTIAWKVLAAAAAAAALLSGCSSVSLDEGAKEGTLAGNQAAQQQTVQDPFTTSFIRKVRAHRPSNARRDP